MTDQGASLDAWRRLDWRFLLPELPRGVLVHHENVTEDLVAALPLLQMDETIRVTSADWPRLEDGTAHLAVLTDPTATDLAEAARVLAPSGCLYVELRWGGRSRRGPRSVIGVRRTLRAAGLGQVQPLWHPPDHASSTRIVPLDRAGAVRRTLMRYDAVRFGHLKSVLGRLALRVGLLPLATSHTSVIAHRGVAAPGQRSLNLLQQHLDTDVDQHALDRLGLRPDAPMILLTPRFPTSRHVIGLVEQERTGETRLVVKVPRRPFDNGGVAREAAVLRDLVTRAPALQDAVPEVLALVDERHHLLLVETALTGPVLDPRQVQADPDVAVRSGLAFIESLPRTGEPTAEDDWFAQVVGTPLARFEHHLGQALPDGADLVQRTRTHLECLASAQLPRVFEHGDLSHPNLFLRPDGLGVIDWERSTPDGLVGLDLVFYLQYVAESQQSAYTRDEQVRVLEQTFLEPSGWGRRLLVDHLSRRGVDPALVLQILLAAWARSASTLVERLLQVEGTVPEAPSAADLASVQGDRDVALWRCVLEYMEGERSRPRPSVR